MSTAGATRVTKNKMTENSHITVRDRSMISHTENEQSPVVTRSQMAIGDAWVASEDVAPTGIRGLLVDGDAA
jgi:hypothetical protein